MLYIHVREIQSSALMFSRRKSIF